jgi:L-asparaginase II
MPIDAVPLIHITRGALVECIHRGHIAIANTEGRVLYAAGDPHYVTYARSSAKLLQAIAVVAAGSASHFGFTEAEIALLCASHNGEPQHVNKARSILGKIGIDDSYLQCGAHAPFHKPSASQLQASGASPQAVHNNCSGKHSGMLALAVHLGLSLHDYKEPEHPVQQAMLAVFAAFAGVKKESVPLGTDGCGVPVYGIPLSGLAAAYARFGTPTGLQEAEACRTVLRAVTAHPEMIAGEDRYDTALIRTTGGRVVGKMGAEGVFAVSLPGEGLGLALKVEDGAKRALYPAVTEALKQLGWISDAECTALASFHMPPVRNWSGDEVGRTVPAFHLV